MHTMNRISLTINGTQKQLDVEPRQSLVDCLREKVMLTGTHIGCEHGVCGACTVIMDGVPARSCITYAVACDGAEITTIEGLDDDLVASELRTAFHEHHGLQCGYCTPAMLISARDIVTRLPGADEERVRLELAGNLCRCTGYVFIVDAINSVLEKHRTEPLMPIPLRTKLGPVGSHPPVQVGKKLEAKQYRAVNQAPQESLTLAKTDLSDVDWEAVEDQGINLEQAFTINHPQDEVWRFFDDLERVARCMPGARLTTHPKNGRAEGKVAIKLGPITSAFSGAVEIERDNKKCRSVVHCAGSDSISGSRARAIIIYHVDVQDEIKSRVTVSVKFLLAGALAQFGRSGLVKNVADHLTKTFADNLEGQLSGTPVTSVAATLDASKIARAAIWDRFTAFLRRLFRN
jgi:carbon-monoxide dehydrogenase small subunit